MKWYENEITETIVKKKYAYGNESSFEDIVERVSSAYTEKDKIKEAMLNGEFTPAGRTLVGMGTPQKVVYNNCFIIGNIEDDSLEAINKADYEISRIGSMGGGVGFAVDNIRPKGSKINNAAKISDGVAFVLNKINNTGTLVGQAGRALALMCAIRDDHPDIFEILHMKQDGNKLQSMNISIKFTDKFMQAVENDEDWELYSKTPNEEIKKTIKARDFFNEFCETQHNWGDPK